MNLFSFVVALLATVPAALAGASTTKQETCDEELHGNHPVLCHMLDRLKTDPQGLAVELSQWAAERGLLAHLQMSSAKISHAKTSKPHIAARIGNNQLPVVFAHGMGDSCYNRGMDDIVKHTSNLLDGVYTTCIAIGKNQHEDTTNGYFLNMDASVDMFAAKIKEDPKLVQGFHAIGFSQGNNVIRGYIARYNDPPVNSFLSVNGVNAGEGAVLKPNKSFWYHSVSFIGKMWLKGSLGSGAPQCSPSLGQTMPSFSAMIQTNLLVRAQLSLSVWLNVLPSLFHRASWLKV